MQELRCQSSTARGHAHRAAGSLAWLTSGALQRVHAKAVRSRCGPLGELAAPAKVHRPRDGTRNQAAAALVYQVLLQPRSGVMV